ncbi:MAG: hypothetical protein ACYSUM_09845 [Planctomycetota bacterium]
MRALLIFTVCVVPLSAALWMADTRRAEATQLPDRALPGSEPAVLVGADLADEYGTAPFGGRLRRLLDFQLRVVEEDYVKVYFSIGRLARHEGQPRLEQVTGAVFDPPLEGKPNLRVTLHAPYVAGDLRTLLHASPAAPRRARFYGGVVVRDPTGRELAHVDTLHVDVTAKTVASDDRVQLHLPDQGAEVRGTGFFADLELREAHLRRDVTVDIVREGRRVTLSCAGTAALAEVADDHLRAVLRDRARIVHSFGAATCDEIRADIEGGTLTQAALAGQVELRLDATAARGLESASAAGLLLDGEDRLDCAGPVTAVWHGRAAPLGLGDRTVDLKAGDATFLLKRSAKARVELEEARFAKGVEAQDRDGPGRLTARLLTAVRDAGRLEATGDVFLKSADGELRAGRLVLLQPKKDRYELCLTDLEELAYVADGQLGPLGAGARGTLHLRAGGPLRIDVEGAKVGKDMRFTPKKVSFQATGGVTARLDERSHLEGEELALTIEESKLVRFATKGKVRLRDTEHAAEARGDRLVYAEGVARIEGRPAFVRAAGRRTVTANSLTYQDDQTFTADRDVRVEAPLSEKRDDLWTFRCVHARGKLTGDGMQTLLARGDVVAAGPRGERAAGDSFEFDGRTGRGVLLGTPARLRRGEDLQLVAEGLDLVVVENAVVAAQTRGSAKLDFLPHGKGQAAAFDRWHVELFGPAHVDERRLTVAKGGRLEAFDKDGKLALKARANRVEATLERTKEGVRARQVRGMGGVEITSFGDRPTTVTADRLDFSPGSNRVDVRGNARAKAEGGPRDVRFEHLVFLVTEDGIDLKRASQIKIRGDSSR